MRHKKHKKKISSSFLKITVLLGVPVILLITLVFLFAKTKAENKYNMNTEESQQKEYEESNLSPGSPEELAQEPLSSPPSASVSAVPTASASPTPKTSNPTSPPCFICSYQADLFWGPVIKSFAGGKNTYYSPLNRMIATTSDNITGRKLPLCELDNVQPVTIPEINISGNCQDPINKGYISGAIDTSNISAPNGLIKGKVTNKSSDCEYEIGLASYKASSTGDSQKDNSVMNIYDYKMITIKPNEIVELMVKSPMVNDNPSCHEISDPVISPLPVQKISSFEIKVTSEEYKIAVVTIPRILFAWNKLDDNNIISNFYIWRWDNDPPVVGRKYDREIPIATKETSYTDWDIKKDINYYYKFCIELRSNKKLVCTQLFDTKGGEQSEKNVGIKIPLEENQVLGVESDQKVEEIFKERPGLLRNFFRWINGM